MTKLQPVSEGETETPVRTQALPAWRNPSYPHRIHIRERAQWEEVLRSCDQRINQARQKLSVVAAGPERATYERLFVQLQGARDQVADAVRRLPGETGDLYEEDKHRVDEAVAAMDRVLRRWDGKA